MFNLKSIYFIPQSAILAPFRAPIPATSNLDILGFKPENFINLQICTRYNLFAYRKKSYQLLICRIAKILPVLELLNHFIKLRTVAYNRVAYRSSVFDTFCGFLKYKKIFNLKICLQI